MPSSISKDLDQRWLTFLLLCAESRRSAGVVVVSHACMSTPIMQCPRVCPGPPCMRVRPPPLPPPLHMCTTPHTPSIIKSPLPNCHKTAPLGQLKLSMRTTCCSWLEVEPDRWVGRWQIVVWQPGASRFHHPATAGKLWAKEARDGGVFVCDNGMPPAITASLSAHCHHHPQPLRPIVLCSCSGSSGVCESGYFWQLSPPCHPLPLLFLVSSAQSLAWWQQWWQQQGVWKWEAPAATATLPTHLLTLPPSSPTVHWQADCGQMEWRQLCATIILPRVVGLSRSHQEQDM